MSRKGSTSRKFSTEFLRPEGSWLEFIPCINGLCVDSEDRVLACANWSRLSVSVGVKRHKDVAVLGLGLRLCTSGSTLDGYLVGEF